MTSDQIQRLATEVAYLAQNMAVSILASTTPSAPTDDRVRSMTDAFATWPLLCRRMAELEDVAPRSSNAGRDRDDELSERRAAFLTKHGYSAKAEGEAA